MSKPKLLLLADSIHSEGVNMLRCHPDLFRLELVSREDDFKRDLAQAQICILRSSWRIEAEDFKRAKSLECIARPAVGVDNIDLKRATELGIPVLHTPQENANAAAEHALALLLALARHIPAASQNLKAGRWDRNRFEGFEVFGKSVGIIGFGNTGTRFAKKLLGLGVKVISYDPYVEPQKFKEFGVQSVSKEHLLSNSDILSLHVPLTDETRGFVAQAEFRLMKKGAYLINCARGAVVHEGDLLEALNRDQLAGAALDVFVDEPPVFPNPLVEHPKVLATPHIGAQTQEAKRAVSVGIAQRLIEYYSQNKLRDVVNPEALERKRND